MYEYLRDDVWAEIVRTDGVGSETDVAHTTKSRGDFIPNPHVNVRGHLTRLTLLSIRSTLLGLSVDFQSFS